MTLAECQQKHVYSGVYYSVISLTQHDRKSLHEMWDFTLNLCNKIRWKLVIKMW